jgi:hypothetical protein
VRHNSDFVSSAIEASVSPHKITALFAGRFDCADRYRSIQTLMALWTKR